MTWFTGIVVYLLVWWMVLFAILPIGTRPDVDGDPAAGGWRGAHGLFSRVPYSSRASRRCSGLDRGKCARRKSI